MFVEAGNDSLQREAADILCHTGGLLIQPGDKPASIFSGQFRGKCIRDTNKHGHAEVLGVTQHSVRYFEVQDTGELLQMGFALFRGNLQCQFSQSRCDEY